MYSYFIIVLQFVFACAMQIFIGILLQINLVKIIRSISLILYLMNLAVAKLGHIWVLIGKLGSSREALKKHLGSTWDVLGSQ